MYHSAPVRSTAMRGSVMAQAPMATMGSTSSYGTQNMPTYGKTVEPSSNMQVRGIYTSASAIQGGTTSNETYGHIAGPRRTPGGNPGGLPDCGCDWQATGEEGIYTCPICNCTWNEFDDSEIDHCHCVEESGYCWCPLELNWSVMLFFAALAAAYTVYKKRTSTVQ